MLGKFPDYGYGLDKVVPVAFHVDYFNKPWKDPFSDPKWSARQAAYCQVLGRKELYYTPLLLVDGKYDALANAGGQVEAALKKALADPVEAALTLAWAPLPRSSSSQKTDEPTKTSEKEKEGDGEAATEKSASPRSTVATRRTLRATVRALAPALEGQELLVGLVVTEGPLTTEVPSGENKGKKLLEYHVARSFAVESVRPRAGRAATVDLRAELKPGWDPKRCRVSVLVQDESTGHVLQADSLPWPARS